jgi:hypothetical protein
VNKKMTEAEFNVANDKLTESFAAIVHEQWECWSQQAASEVSPETQLRWQRYWVPYEELSEDSKELDREWARRYRVVMREQIFPNMGPEELEQLKKIPEMVEAMQDLAKGTQQLVQSIEALMDAYKAAGGDRSAAAGRFFARSMRRLLDGASLADIAKDLRSD